MTDDNRVTCVASYQVMAHGKTTQSAVTTSFTNGDDYRPHLYAKTYERMVFVTDSLTDILLTSPEGLPNSLVGATTSVAE